MHALRGIQRPTWNVSNQPKNVFDRCVIIYTSSASACGICVKNKSYEYTLCVDSLALAIGYIHRTQFEEHLKQFEEHLRLFGEHLRLFEEHLKLFYYC